MPDPQRKQSAFDVLLGKRKQPSTPPTSALEALERALTRAGGSLSPASSPNTKRVRTPRGQSSYATCPVCSKTLPRALLEAHTSDCIDTRGAQQAAEPAMPLADPGSPAAGVESEAQPCPVQQRSGSGALQHPEDTPPRAASPADPQRVSVRGGHRQARLDGGAILSAPACRGSAPALSAKAGTSGNSRQTRLDNGMALKQPPSRATSEADATDSSAQAQTPPAGVPAAEPAGAGDAVPASPAGSPAGNAFATMMQRQRQLAQVQQFFLERCGDGEWKWHWWLKAPGGDASDANSKGGSGSTRPSSHAVWSASTAVSFSATGPKVNLKLMTNVPPSEEAATEWGWGAAQPSNANEGRWHGGGPHGAAGPLKSALQKTVRLCRGHSAVRIALYLLKDNPIEVLRRLAVICLEDAVLPPAYPALVWLMAATSKGYTLSRDHVNLVLTIVQQIAAVPVRDSSRPAAGPDDSQADADAAADDGPTSDQRLAAIDAEMPPGAAAHVKAMLLRASYGGMQGDQAMLRRYADLWQDRFAGRSGPPPPLPAPPGQFTTAAAASAAAAPASWLQYVHEVNELNSGGLVNVGLLGPMRKADIPLSAIDFHCSTIADDVQQEEEILAAGREVVDNDADGLLEGIDDAFRKVMWHFRSGVNMKQLMPGAAQPHNQDLLQLLEPLWRVSAGPLDAWSQTFIRKRFY